MLQISRNSLEKFMKTINKLPMNQGKTLSGLSLKSNLVLKFPEIIV
jgi:hypothetical protein